MVKGKTDSDNVSKTSQSESEDDKSKDFDIQTDNHQQLNEAETIKDIDPLVDNKFIKTQSPERSETNISHKNTEIPSIQEDKSVNVGHTQSFQEDNKNIQQNVLNSSQKNTNENDKPTHEYVQGSEDIKSQLLNQIHPEKQSVINPEVSQKMKTKKDQIPEQIDEKHSKESSNYQPEEENDGDAEEWRSKKQRTSGIKKRKRPIQVSLQDNGNSYSNENQLNQNKVVERKRGIRDLTTDEKWGVYDRYHLIQSYRGVGREYNMDHSTVKLLIQRIKNEQPEGATITKEMFLQGDIAKQGQEPVITKKLKKELMKAAKNHLNSEQHSSGHDQMDGQVHLFDQDLNVSDGNQNEPITQQTTKQKKLRVDKKEQQQNEFYYQDGDKCVQNEGSIMDDPTLLPSLHSSKSKTKLSTEEKELRKQQRIEKRMLKQDEKEIKKNSKGKGTLGDIGNSYGYSSGQQSHYPNQQLDNQQINNAQSQQIPQNPFLDPSHDDIHHIFPGFFTNSMIKYPNFPSGDGQQLALNQYVYAQNMAVAQQHLTYPFLAYNTQQQQQDDFDHIIDNIDIHAQTHAMPQENANHNNNQNGHNFDDEIQLELS